MYQIAIYIYQLGVFIASFFNDKAKKMWHGERQAINILRNNIDPEAKYIWFHAASLGEFEQGRPLIEHIRQKYPQYKILLTFFSPSGYEIRKNYEGADIICYLPLDTISNARRFLRTIRPVMAFFIKYEFWYNYLHILKHRGVPVYSVSSIFRDKQIFFRWYGRQYAYVLRCFTHFFVQNEKSRDLLSTIGIRNVSIVGDTRFDRVLQIRNEAQPLPIVANFKANHKTFIAGSSWQPDEEIFIPYIAKQKGWKMIVAPHVISEEHLQSIEALIANNGLKSIRYTDQEHPADTTTPQQSDADVLIINCFGLLSSIYQYADVCYIGGGFGVGIHNTVEAAVWGKPVIFGPNNLRFREAQDLKLNGGGIEIASADDFAKAMQRLTNSEQSLQEAGRAAGQYVENLAGATFKIVNEICFDTYE